ncbi:MAG: cation:proton antiporter [Lachnospiraceae bacterium]|nr:cation:proton antiporter [Lachnospiraceae bacterium]
MEMNLLTYIALLLFFALVAGKVAKKFQMPNVTGYLVMGLLIGPYGFGLLSKELVSDFGIVSEMALGFIAFSIGAEFRLKYLKKVGKAPVVIAVFEALTAVLLVDFTLLLLGYDLTLALCIGAIASATAAASTLMVVKQYKANGPVTRTLLPVVAIDDAVALMAFGISIAIAKTVSADGGGSLLKTLLAPVIEIVGGLLFGALLGFILTQLVKWYTGRGNRLALTCGMIFFCIGASEMWGFSSLLACMMMSAVFVNMSSVADKIFEPIERTTPPIYMMFFIISGASLDITIIPKIGLIGIIYIVFRVLGKMLGSYIGASICHASAVVKKYLGLTLVPQEGVAIGLVTVAMNSVPQYGDTIQTVILCGIVVYELTGPLITKLALKAAKEI